MLCKLTKNPVLATQLLSDSGKCRDLNEIHPEVTIKYLISFEYFYRSLLFVLTPECEELIDNVYFILKG